LVQSLKKGLEKEGYTVDISYDGESGLLLAKTTPYDVIVLDWILPKIGGLKVLELLNKQGTTASILLLVDQQLLDNKPSGVIDTADDILQKPFHFEELLSRLQKLTYLKNQKYLPVIKLNHLKINTVSHQVWVNGEEVILLSVEYHILEYLACHPNEVIDHNTLWTHLYQWQDETFSDLLDGCVNKLHLKIDKDSQTRTIQIIHDKGFMLKIDPSESKS
jgi:two-component system, OmpR family, response regulator PhoP